MKFDIRRPPRAVSRYTEEITEWCEVLATKLKMFFVNIDDDNISSMSVNKITAIKASFGGGLLTISDTGFKLETEDGAQYIELAKGKLNIKGNIINDLEVDNG